MTFAEVRPFSVAATSNIDQTLSQTAKYLDFTCDITHRFLLDLKYTHTTSDQTSRTTDEYHNALRAPIYPAKTPRKTTPPTTAMSQVIEITSEEDFNSHVSGLDPNTLLLLSFHTPWAAPCAQMNTVLKTLAASYPVTIPARTTWLSVNAEDLPDVSDAYDVTAVPFLVLSRAGQVLETVSGSDAGKVRAAIEKHAAGGEKVQDEEFVLPPKQHVTYRETSGTSPTADLSGYAPAKEDDSTTTEAAAAGETSKEDLDKRLTELVKAAPVMLFMKGTPSAPQCGFSRQLVALLRENGVKYGFFNILADDEVRQGLKEFADWPTFPQLWVGGELAGGLDIVSFCLSWLEDDG